jgi:hypothetical protein
MSFLPDGERGMKPTADCVLEYIEVNAEKL